MLYERWRQVAKAHSARIALEDVAAGRQWTFQELALAGEQATRVAGPGRVVFPREVCAEFILSVLHAWRFGSVACPLENDQVEPHHGPALPAGIVHLKTTSATSGTSRLIAFTAEQLAADAENIVATMGLRPDWPNLGVISLAHSYGFSNLVLPLLLHGIPLILVSAPLPEMLKRAAARERALTLAAVPALWRAWHDSGAIPENVRLAISAGAPLPLAIEQDVFARTGLKIHNFYGSSECGGIAYDGGSIPRTDVSFVGTPMRNVTVRVAEQGCIEVRSRAVGQGYWPQASPNLRNGIFQTDDMGEINSDHVHLRGRVSDLINVAGRKLSPETVEKILLDHPAVAECLVFGAPIDGERSEIIVACVVARAHISGDGLRQFLLEKLPAWQVPREWWMVDSLAANERGKIPRAEWRRRFVEVTAASENLP